MPLLVKSRPNGPYGPNESAASSGASAAAAWAGVLDAAALEQLSALDPGGKAGLLGRVLGTYASSLGKLLDQLASARASQDLQVVRHVAHTLKSSSASVGALPLSALCARVEQRVREEHLEGIESDIELLAAEGQRVAAALTAGLGGGR